MCHYFRSRQYQTRPGLAGASTSPAVPHTTQLSSALPSCGGGATPTFCPNSNDTIEERIQSSCLQPLSKTRLPGGRQPSLEHILSQDFKCNRCQWRGPEAASWRAGRGTEGRRAAGAAAAHSQGNNAAATGRAAPGRAPKPPWHTSSTQAAFKLRLKKLKYSPSLNPAQ